MEQANHYVDVKGLSKHFGASKVFEDLSFAIEEGEFITLLGPSGCGKSTLLRCLAGLETPDEGSIFVNGEDITHVKPQKRGIGMVFQSYALFPNMTAAENIAFGLRIAKVPEAEIRQRVTEMLEVVSLKGFDRRRIDQLSGGQQQRVAIARALVNNPQMIIADEPTGNLDPMRSLEIMMLLERINELGTTVLVVTHAKELVNRFSKRVVAIENGRIISDETGGYYNNETTI